MKSAVYVTLFLVAIVVANAGPLVGNLGAGLNGYGNLPLDRGLGVGLNGYGSPLVAAQGGHVAAAYGAGAGLAGGTPNVRIAPSGVPVPAGHGLEGQYIHDFSERLYDDGTYKPQVYGA